MSDLHWSLRRVLEGEPKSTWQRDVEMFMAAADTRGPSNVDFSAWPGELRCNLIDEEAQEIRAAWLAWQSAETPAQKEQAEAHIIDGLVDLIYVAIGAASAAGVSLEPFWGEVHRANMRKFSHGILKNAAGKVIKPPGWVGPDMVARLREEKGETP